MKRHTRYQGAIIRDDCILLVKHREHVSGRSYWVIPGGAREPDETGEDCVKREMLEKTHLEVTIERVLLEEAGVPSGSYRHLKTYLCRADAGDASPGYESEYEPAQEYVVAEVRWFDLREPKKWDPQVKTDPFTYPLLRRIQALLGYRVAR